MVIMSFNTQHCLNYITRKIDYDVMADAIKQCNADIVGLNEMRDKGWSRGFDRQTELLSKATGLDYFYFGRTIWESVRNPFGNGFLSRYKIVDVEMIPIPDPLKKAGNQLYETRGIIKAVLENGLTVLVTHFGLNDDEQINAVNTIIENLPEEKAILMGDFNVTPDNPVLDPIKERMRDTADVMTEQKLSFPSGNPVKKIDYIFVTSDIQVVSADIPDIVASDHRPFVAEIKL